LKPRYLIAFAGLALSWPAMRARGQASPAPSAVSSPLTLALAIQQAQARYPAIRAALAQQEAAHDAIGVAKTAYLPRADMIWQGNRATTNKPNIAFLPQGIVPVPDTPARPTTGHSDWNTLTGVLLAWQPFDFGVRHAQVDMAKFGFQSAQHATDLTRLNVASAAAGAYLDVVAALQMVTVEQANVDRMQSFARTVHILVDNTLRPGADASQADAQLAVAQTQLIKAQTQEQIRLEALANLLQIPSQQVAIDGRDVLGTPSAATSNESPAEAHPQAEQLAAVLSQQKEQIHLLNRSYVPAFTFYGSASGLGAGLSNNASPVFLGGGSGLAPTDLNWMAAFQVTFPALQIFTIRQQKEQQKAQLSSIQASYQQMLGDLSAQQKEAKAMLDGARRIAGNTAVEVAAARTSESQQKARYSSGLATVVEVSTSEAALAQAEGDDAVARVNIWRGLAGVAEAQGDLTPFLQLLKQQP
jgi:outer membrane protein